MRFHIGLTAQQKHDAFSRETGAFTLSANYHHALSSAIYGLVSLAEPDFAANLHEIGFRLQNKIYKLFTFALRFTGADKGLRGMQIADGVIRLYQPQVELRVTSPLAETFMRYMMTGLLKQGNISICTGGGNVTFEVTSMEQAPDISVSDTMRFQALSPIVCATKRFHSGRLQKYYLRPSDTEEFSRVLTGNLTRKYTLLTGKEITCEPLTIEWDADYCARHGRITKKITMHEHGQFPIDIIGVQAPFRISGASELLQVGYECGFGEHNAMGMGMVEVDMNKKI